MAEFSGKTDPSLNLSIYCCNTSKLEELRRHGWDVLRNRSKKFLGFEEPVHKQH